ncbi:MAG: sulfite exporter TauE/SafE family protein [Planctomycetota bacterium]|nr:sulfite exporter TauE/SafE family protein [Planctomycetota bacterium]
MSKALSENRFRVSGMVCRSCEGRIGKRLGKLPGIRRARADYRGGWLDLAFDPEQVSLDRIGSVLEEMGYEFSGAAPAGGSGKWREAWRAAGLLIAILGLYVLAARYGLLDFLNIFPEAEAGMGYGTLFVVGLLTSAHCLAMCGGINISQSAAGVRSAGDRASAFIPPLLYGGGRVASYTAIGALAGGLGSVISFSGAAKGIVQLAAGVLMMIMGLNLTGWFPWLRRITPGLPSFLSGKAGAAGNRGPLFVGLLNGLMPCGPLQAMQLYALSTGGPVEGGLSMLFFSLGTLPLTTGLGFAAAYLGRRFMGQAIRAGAILVFLMGMAMLANGLRLSGLDAPGFYPGGEAAAALVADGVQTVETELSPGSYRSIRVQAGIPLRWNLHASREALNGCNNRIFIPAFGIERKLVPGDNIIEFMPDKSGVYPYSCWMGMIASRIIVGDAEDSGDIPDIDPEALPISREGEESEIPWL